MNNATRHIITACTSGLLLGCGVILAQGCDQNPGGPLGDLAAECGLTCDVDAFARGKANISGVAEIDAFFGAAIDLETAIHGVDADLRAELDAIAVSVGAAPGSSGAEIKAALDAHLSGYIDGGLALSYEPARCEASIEANVNAAAACDANVEPGGVSAECSGTCELDASAEVDCGASAELVCRGAAPELSCEGVCEGQCTVEGVAELDCGGTCRGECVGVCSLVDADGQCQGQCEGLCTGACTSTLSAGAQCDGLCEGTCEYTPPSGSCEADASASCRAMGDASIECEGKCQGEVIPPEVSAECEATVEAKASASVECTPPSLRVDWQWAAGVEGDVRAQAEFKAWLEGFKARFAAILALEARGALIADAAVNLSTSGEAALMATLETLESSGDLKASIGAACAIGQLPDAVDALATSSASLAGSIEAAASLTTAF